MRHVLDIHLYLLSTRVLDDESYHSYFNEAKWKFIKGSLIVIREKKLSTFYMIQVKLYKKEVNIVEDFFIEL